MGLAKDCQEFVTPDGRVFNKDEAVMIDCIWQELSRLSAEIRQVNAKLEQLIFALATKGG